MSYIPDCRKDEYYNENKVKGSDKEFLRGFDWCTQMAVDNFFDNEMFGLAEEGEYLGHILCEKVPEDMQEEYYMESTFPDAEDEKRKVETYADLVRMKILEWIELERNELIVSMIEENSEEE